MKTLADVAHPGHLSDPHPLSSRGASELHRDVITNTTPRPFQEQLPGPNKEQGSRNSLPTCSWAPGATRRAGERAVGEERPPLPAPSRGGYPALPPPSRAGGGTLERMEPPRAGCPGGAGSSEPRGTRRYLWGPGACPRCRCTAPAPAAPPCSARRARRPARRLPERRPPVPPLFRSPARSGGAAPGRHGLAGRWGSHGRDRPRRTRPPPAPPALIPLRRPWGGPAPPPAPSGHWGAGKGTRSPPRLPGSGETNADCRGTGWVCGSSWGACPHEGVCWPAVASAVPWALRDFGPEWWFGEVLSKPRRKEGNNWWNCCSLPQRFLLNWEGRHYSMTLLPLQQCFLNKFCICMCVCVCINQSKYLPHYYMGYLPHSPTPQFAEVNMKQKKKKTISQTKPEHVSPLVSWFNYIVEPLRNLPKIRWV